MKQAGDPTNTLRRLQDAARGGTINHTTFTGDDNERKKKRMETLTSSKKGNKFKLPEKKALATRVFDRKKDIEADILAVDPAGHFKLERCLKRTLKQLRGRIQSRTCRMSRQRNGL